MRFLSVALASYLFIIWDGDGMEPLLRFLTWAAACYLAYVALRFMAILHVHGKSYEMELDILAPTHPFILFLSIVFVLWRAFG